MRKGHVVAALLAALALPAAARADTPGPGHHFAITREGDARLPDHTIFHPTDMTAPRFRLPIVVWGNGGCRDSNEEFRYFLMRFAARGFFIVANGQPGNPYNPQELDGLIKPQPQKLIAGIDWALAENARPSSKYYGRLDPSRIVAMGQSCGGWEAVDASADKRVKTTVVWNNGGDPHAGDVTKLHAPVLFANGGTSDYAYPLEQSGWLRTTVPAVLAQNTNVGHTGMWDPPAEGDPDYRDEPLPIGTKWLQFQLYRSVQGRAYFLGDPCGLCQREGWTVESKNWG
jgi:dienelactone hydrolase